MGHADKPAEAVHADAGDFLARWSQRKLEAARQGTEAVAADTDTAQETAEPDAAAETSAAERELTDADMPPLESLTADSDYSPFLSPGVSDGLRRLALRKLFSQPDFNVTDGLNDYDEDYTQFANLGNVITHEMKRMLTRDQKDRERGAPPVAEPLERDAALTEAERQTEVIDGEINRTGDDQDQEQDNDNCDPGDGSHGAADKTP